MRRRAFLAAPLALLAQPAPAGEGYPDVVPGRALAFPRDHGAHPEFRTEWWYVTGWLRQGTRDIGFQVTFFRSRPRIGEDSPSAFAPRQLLFAHAAVADPASGRLLHDQRAARAGFGLAAAREDSTGVHIDDWSLALDGGVYRTRIAAREFAFDLAFTPSQPTLLQGESGYSRKGPAAGGQASYYYSRPQLAVSGTLERNGRRERVDGTAWLDHEWSSEYLAPEAAGWDWVGLNLDGGGALMAFRIRAKAGGVFWAGGGWRDADGRTRVLAPGDVRFEPTRRWRSPRTEIEYPVAMRLRAGERELVLEPLMDDQELDSRASTGALYWEGAVTASEGARRVGRGYLELTGYGKPLRL